MQSSDRRYLSFHRCCSSRRHNEAVQLRALCYTPLTTISNSVLLTTPPNPAISELKQTPSIEDLGNRHILAYSWSSYFFSSADGLKQSDLAAIAEVTPLRRVLKAYRASCKDNTISAPFLQVTYAHIRLFLTLQHTAAGQGWHCQHQRGSKGMMEAERSHLPGFYLGFHFRLVLYKWWYYGEIHIARNQPLQSGKADKATD